MRGRSRKGLPDSGFAALFRRKRNRLPGRGQDPSRPGTVQSRRSREETGNRLPSLPAQLVRQLSDVAGCHPAAFAHPRGEDWLAPERQLARPSPSVAPASQATPSSDSLPSDSWRVPDRKSNCRVAFSKELGKSPRRNPIVSHTLFAASQCEFSDRWGDFWLAQVQQRILLSPSLHSQGSKKPRPVRCGFRRL